MQLLAMDLPAEIHRRITDIDHPEDGSTEVIVARGPFVIMAHGLCAIDPVLRGSCWITSEAGDFNAEEAEEVLRTWSARVNGHDGEV